MKKLMVLWAVMTAVPAFAQINCEAFEAAIDKELRDYSSAAASGITGSTNPAADATRRSAMANSIALINANVNLMALNKCAVPKEPIGPVYLGAALTCSGALLAARERKETAFPPECDRKNWKKGGAAKGPGATD